MPPDRPPPRVLFDGDHVQLLHFARPGRPRLLTFDIMHARANGRSAFGKRLCEALDWDLIALVPRYPCWYPAPEMARIIPRVQALGGPASLAYGASMGGYGALRWGRALGADRVLACSPQASIDPAVTGPADRRYARHFHAALHADMQVRAAHLPPLALVLFDPHFRPDRRQAEMLDLPGVTRLALPHMGHRAAECLTGSAHALAVFEDLRAGRIEAIRRRLIMRRKHTETYRIHLADHALRQARPDWARALAQAVSDPWARHRLLARQARTMRDFAAAADHYRAALAQKPGCRQSRLQLEELIRSGLIPG